MIRRPAVVSALLLALLTGCGAHRAAQSASPTATVAAAVPAPTARTVAKPSRRAPEALVTDEAQNRLLAVGLPGGRITQRVPLPDDPEDIAAGSVVIVVSSQAGAVTVLDRSSLRPIRTFGGFDRPHIAAVSPDGQYAYITDDARGTLTVIRLSDLRVTSTIRVGPGAHHLTVSPNERQIWVALGESAQTVVILSTVARTPAAGASPVIDPGHPHVIGSFTPGFRAHDLSFTPDGRQVWISSATGPEVTAFAVRSRRMLFRVPVGAPPQHLAFEGRFAYVTSGYGSTIEKVDATTGRIITRAPAPYGSFELAAADGFVASASLLRGTLAVYTPSLKLLRVVKLAPATREVAITKS
jgi:DNA-binding beta-propeller fold protein YncE